MIVKKKTTSSSRWLIEHFKDIYVNKAKKNNIRSRSWFKLKQINDANKLLKINSYVLDLGSSPGGWSQYARSQIGKKGRIIACDLLSMLPIPGVDFFKGDLRKKNVFNLFLKYLDNIKFNLVMSDMSPNITGHSSIDIPNSIRLCHLALQVAEKVLYKNGFFLFKSFQGEGFNEFYKEIKILFSQVKICKPKTSRTRSREIFILATK